MAWDNGLASYARHQPDGTTTYDDADGVAWGLVEDGRADPAPDDEETDRAEDDGPPAVECDRCARRVYSYALSDHGDTVCWNHIGVREADAAE